MSYFSLGGGGPGGHSDEDGDFLGNSSVPNSSKLSSLFGLNQKITNAPDSNQSLQYNAPRPPGSSPAPTRKKQAKNSSGVLFVTVVTAYKLVNNENKLQGKLGAAILKNTETKDFKILMYVTKQQPVTTCQITPAFNIAIQANNYASFYDDKQQSWTVLFDSIANIQLFAKNIALAKYFSSKSTPSSSITQDLNPNSNQSNGVETGDSLEVKYTGWLVGEDCSLGEVFDSNVNKDKTFRFKSGKGKVIKGWESGMMGMVVGGKRFLVIPPQLAYGEKSVGNKIPPNSILAFEVDLLRVKQSKENISVKSSSSVESIPQATGIEQITQPDNVNGPPNIQEKPNFLQPNNIDIEQSVKVRTNSINQQLSGTPPNIGDGKGNLVSRMAKMGHSMFPAPSVPQQNMQVHNVPPNTPQAANPPPNNQQVAPSSQNPVQINQEVPIQQPVQHQILTNQSPLINQQMPVNQHINQQTPVNQPVSYNQQVNQQTPINQPPTSYNQQQQYANMSPSPNSMVFGSGYNQQTSTNPYGQQQISQQPMSQYQPLHQQQMGYGSEQYQQSTSNPYNSLHQIPQYPNMPGYESSFLPILVSESKQQNSQLKTLQEKVDKVSDSVEYMKKNSEANQLNPNQHMDTTIVIHNIQRIVQENEKLKQQVLDKSKQIENQNDKIGELLQQNQKHVEKSNLILEQRNDSYKESFDQSRARNLVLEDQIKEITQRLNESGSKVTELNLEVEDLNRREQEFKQKFKGIYLTEKEKTSQAEETINELEEKLKENEQKLKASLKNETLLKSEKQDLELKLKEFEITKNQLTEEHSDNISSLIEEKNQLESMITQLKQTHLSEIENIKSGDQEKENQKLTSLKEEFLKLKSEFDSESESRREAEEKITAMQTRFAQVRSLFEEQKLKLESAIEDLEETTPYKEAYEKLRMQATVMKKKYEEKINELQESLENQDKNNSDSTGVIDEVKKLMNVIFQRVKSQLELDEQYDGSYVLRLLMAIIKKTTIELLSRKENENESEEGNKEKGKSEEIVGNSETVDENKQRNKEGDDNDDKEEVEVREVLIPEKEEGKTEEVDVKQNIKTEEGDVNRQNKNDFEEQKNTEVTADQEEVNEKTEEIQSGEISQQLEEINKSNSSISVEERQTGNTNTVAKNNTEENKAISDETENSNISKNSLKENADNTNSQESENAEISENDEKLKNDGDLQNTAETDNEIGLKLQENKSELDLDTTVTENVVEDVAEDVKENEQSTVNKTSTEQITVETQAKNIEVETSPDDDVTQAVSDVTQPPNDATVPANDVKKEANATTEQAQSLSLNDVIAEQLNKAEFKKTTSSVSKSSSRSSSILSDSRQPPPLFDDESDDSDLDWFNK